MATRTSIRPRPIDPNKQLPIVRDVGELDTTEGLPGESAPEQQQGLPLRCAAAPQDPHHPHQKKPKPKEIPVPEVKQVPTYTRDYLPTFKIPDTYIRGQGGVGYAVDDFVEYDLDTEDEKWLAAYNHGCELKLNDMKFERMLWRLELAWAEAMEATLTPPEKATPQGLASTACLPKIHAVPMLKKSVGGRSTILEAVYEYWQAKRKRWGKPLLRRLQAPTNPSDSNPYNVFRPREKVNRPFTRRRRENNAESADKLRMIHDNMLHAMEITELMVVRERKKRDIHQVDICTQKLQIAQHHLPRHECAATEQQILAKMQEIQANKVQTEPRITAYIDAAAGGYANAELDTPLRVGLVQKRRRIEREARARQAVTDPTTLAPLPPPPPAPEQEPLWVFEPNAQAILAAQQQQDRAASGASASTSAMSAAAAAAIANREALPYVARGGRLALARCDPLTRQPIGELIAAQQGPQHALANGCAPAGVQGMGAHNTDDPFMLKPPLPCTNPHMMSRNTLFPWQSEACTPWSDSLDVSLLPDGEHKTAILASRAARAAQPEYLDQLASAAASLGVPPFAALATQAPPPAATPAGAGAAGAVIVPSKAQVAPAKLSKNAAASQQQQLAAAAAAPAGAPATQLVVPGGAMNTLRELLHPKTKVPPSLVPSQQVTKV